MGVEREEIEKARTTTQTATTQKMTMEERKAVEDKLFSNVSKNTLERHREAVYRLLAGFQDVFSHNKEDIGRWCAICIIADEAGTHECSHAHVSSLAGHMWAAKGRLTNQARRKIILGLTSTSMPETKGRSRNTKEDRCAICIMVGGDGRGRCAHAQDPVDHMWRVGGLMTYRMRRQVIRGLTRKGKHPNSLRSNERDEGGGKYCDDESVRILEEHRRDCEAILEKRREEARRLAAVIQIAAGHAPPHPWSDRPAEQELRTGGAERRH